MTTSPQSASAHSDSADEALALLERDSQRATADDGPFDQLGSSSGSWHGGPSASAQEPLPLAEEVDDTSASPWAGGWSAHWSADGSNTQLLAGSSAAPWSADGSNTQQLAGSSAAPATEYSVSPGLTGRATVLAATAAACLIAAFDAALTGRISFFFDLCFVVLCLALASGVRRRDLFTAAVLPPLLLAVVVAGAAVLAPATLAASDGLSAVFLKGLAAHAGALLWGYAVALATVGARIGASRGSKR